MCQRNSATSPTQPQLRHREAIDFALDALEPWELAMFFTDFRAANLEPWPEFIDYLAKRDTESTA